MSFRINTLFIKVLCPVKVGKKNLPFDKQEKKKKKHLAPNQFEIIYLQYIIWQLKKLSIFSHVTFLICYVTILNNIHKYSYKSSHNRPEVITLN